MRALGDKAYAVVDMSPDFCKQEGLIPGFRDKRPSRGVVATREVEVKPRPSHAEKKRAEDRRAELMEVLALPDASGDDSP